MQTEGPVLILAGAGSGKTRVITHRIAWLIDECGVNPWNILAITFTNKAAGEMRERVDKLVGFGSESIWVSTFHSMCARILRRYIDRIGYDTSFAIYDTDDQKTVIKDILKKLSVDPKEMAPRAVLSAISSAKNELVTPLRYREDTARDYRERVIAEAYDEYQRTLRSNNALDFDDLLMLTVELFNADEEVLHYYQDRFKYIMVDEYQDTNTAQFELIRLLAGKYRNLCVVGDDDQSIYKFRGANIRNILDFEKLYPDAFVVRLEQNYRSTQNVLSAANAVIKNNTKRKSKTLRTDLGEGSLIHFRAFQTAPEEAAFIAQDIERCMRKDRKLSYKDFAVLYRTNAQSRLLEEKLIMESVPYNVVGGTNFYERREIRDMLAYLKTVCNAVDDLAVRRIINVPRRGIGATTIGRMTDFAAQQSMNLFDAMCDELCLAGIGRASVKVKEFTDLILEFREFAKTASVQDLIRHVVEKTNYEEELRASEEEDAEDRIANIDELISKAASYEESRELSEEGATLSGFLEEVALIADIDDVEEGDDRVLLMTLHSAKGLEFPHVYMAGMEDGLFPSRMSIDDADDDAVEEERRLAYVGITRAKEELTLTYAMSRMMRGDVHYSGISRFVLEIPQELLDEKPVALSGRRDDSLRLDFDDLPDSDDFSDRGYRSCGRGGYGSQSYGSQGYGSKSYGGEGYGSAGYHGLSSYGEGAPRTDRRPKAVYVPPHTKEERKPFIAKQATSLQKGMPAAGTKPDYVEGDRVRHIKYGEGTVLKIEENPRDYKVTVMFDEAGQKIMYAAFARLEKV